MKLQPKLVLFILAIFLLIYFYNYFYKEEDFSTPSDRYCETIITSKECDEHISRFLQNKGAFLFGSDFKVVKNHNCVRKCNKLLNSDGGRAGQGRDGGGGIDLYGYFWKILYLSLEDDKLKKNGTFCFDSFRPFGKKGSERQDSQKNRSTDGIAVRVAFKTVNKDNIKFKGGGSLLKKNCPRTLALSLIHI